MLHRLALILILSCLTYSVLATKPHSKLTSCQEFTHGLNFNDSQAIGTWHLLHYKTEKAYGSVDPYCLEFTPMNDQERKELSDRIGKYVENLKWENLTLRMRVPCSAMKSNRTRDYFLERLEKDGSYRTLQMPLPTAKLDLAEFHRYPLRLKMVEGQFLGMLDCHEQFVFLLGKQPAAGARLDARLRKMIEVYWPEEHD